MVVTDPEALICECGHQKATHWLGKRGCQGDVIIEGKPGLHKCTCPRFKFWYDDDDDSLIPSEQEIMDSE